MKITFTKQFRKETKLLPLVIQQRIITIIDTVEKVENLSQVNDCKKLIGIKDTYRIRTGDYRLIIVLIVNADNTVEFNRVQHRSKVYKKHFL